MGQARSSVRFPLSDTVDFVIVGSGAAGGILARELATAGHSVVVLEQGPRLSEADFDHDEFGAFMQARHANSMTTQPQTFRAASKERADQAWTLIYGRLVGGSNAHFTGNFWRLRPIDFHEASALGGVPGTGLVDWPISYEDLSPYYDKVESYIGVFGTKENIPSAPDGIFQPPPKPRCPPAPPKCSTCASSPPRT